MVTDYSTKQMRADEKHTSYWPSAAPAFLEEMDAIAAVTKAEQTGGDVRGAQEALAQARRQYERAVDADERDRTVHCDCGTWISPDARRCPFCNRRQVK